MNGAIADSVDQEQARARLRQQHRVQLVTREQEGNAIDKVSAGTYGFTYAPATESPIFARRCFQSFEMHRMPDGTGRLIGFCTPEEAQRLAQGSAPVEITLYPEPYKASTQIVSIAVHELANDLYRPVRREGNAVHLQVVPEGALSASR